MRLGVIALFSCIALLSGCSSQYGNFFRIVVNETVQDESRNDEIVFSGSRFDVATPEVSGDSLKQSVRRIEITRPSYALEESKYDDDMILWYRDGVPYQGLSIVYNRSDKKYTAILYSDVSESKILFKKSMEIPVVKDVVDSHLVFRVDLESRNP